MSVKLQALRIGELGIVAIPCEVFTAIGLDIKKMSPMKKTFTIELANGYNGYLPTPEQHKLGGYETWRAIELSGDRGVAKGDCRGAGVAEEGGEIEAESVGEPSGVSCRVKVRHPTAYAAEKRHIHFFTTKNTKPAKQCDKDKCPLPSCAPILQGCRLFDHFADFVLV